MDILHLETEASKLRIKLVKTTPPRNKIFLLYSFFQLLLDEKNRNIAESYLLEFDSQYYHLLSRIEVTGINPALIEAILKQSIQVLPLSPVENKTSCEASISILKVKFEKLTAVLSGENSSEDVCVCLPLLQKEGEKFDRDYGILSTLGVQVKPVEGNSKFHIIPGRGEPEPELKLQVENSLVNALRIAGKYTKIKHSSWDVYIDFENKTGEYKGSSFGVLLVLKLVEEILRFYDPPTKIYSDVSAALTGTVNEDGTVPPLTKDIIAAKTKIVFFSAVRQFIIPEDDFADARDTLRGLQAEYPERNLKLIGIQSADDLFDLRNVVTIKKESAVLRTGKFIRRQALALFLLVPLAAIIIFSGIFDFDRNPEMFTYSGRLILIKNKSGKTLWNIKSLENLDEPSKNQIMNNIVRIRDINDDGVNEVIACRQNIPLDDPDFGRVICYNYKKEKLWQYVFRDQVFTPEYKHTPIFSIALIDIVKENKQTVLYAFANNNPLYPSAIFKLDALTGKRVDSTKVLWSSGCINSAVIGDFDSDGRRELTVIGINNGYERSVLFSIDIDSLNGRSPAPPYYEILGKDLARYDHYLLLPKSDLTRLYYRWDSPIEGSLFYKKSNAEYNFMIGEYGPNNIQRNLLYRCDKDMRNFYIDCSDDFQTTRDSLVNSGKLNSPLTYTVEYFRSLKEQLRYWDGKKFVTAKERFGDQRH